VIQIVAALIPALNGVSIQALSNPNIFSPNAYWVLNWLSVPITVLWIVGITNAVNLIDGLDGLANGVSAIFRRHSAGDCIDYLRRPGGGGNGGAGGGLRGFPAL